MVFGSPKKNVIKAITKIKKGYGSQKVVDSLNRTLNNHPELIEEAASQLISIIQTDKTETFGYAIDVLLTIAEMEPDLLANSAEAIIKIIQTSDDKLDTDTTLKAMDILSIIATGYPELMQPAVPVLLKMLHNQNSNVRSASYYILDIIAKPHPEFFSNYTLDLIRCLHGLNIDERVYAARLIGKIANVTPSVIDESYDVLSDLAYKHPDTKVRQEAYDVLQKFKVEEKEATVEEPEEELLDFEKDFIGLDEIKSEEGDFGMLADELSERIKGIDFEASAADLLKSIGMGHLIVKPEFKESDSASAQLKEVTTREEEKIDLIRDEKARDEKASDDIIKPEFKVPDEIKKPPTTEILKKLPPKPEPKKKTTPDYTLKRIEQLVTDPNIRPRLSPVKDITQKNDLEIPESEVIDEIVSGSETKEELPVKPTFEYDLPIHESIDETRAEIKKESDAVDAPVGQPPDITIEMIDAIFEDISNEDWVINVALTTCDGRIVTASDPDSLDDTVLRKICDMLSLEESLSRKERFRNRVSIELSDRLLVAMSINSGHIILISTKPDIQFGLVLYELNKTADRIEQILK